MVYAGQAGAMLEYFTSIGYPCPSLTNPCDFYIDLTTIDHRHKENEAVSRERLSKLLNFFKVGLQSKLLNVFKVGLQSKLLNFFKIGLQKKLLNLFTISWKIYWRWFERISWYSSIYYEHN